MNNNEIMNNEVVEATEEVIENAGLSKGVKIAAGIGLSVVVGVVVYKYVAKPVIANIKAQIEQKKMAAEEKTVIRTRLLTKLSKTLSGKRMKDFIGYCIHCFTCVSWLALRLKVGLFWSINGTDGFGDEKNESVHT